MTRPALVRRIVAMASGGGAGGGRRPGRRGASRGQRVAAAGRQSVLRPSAIGCVLGRAPVTLERDRPGGRDRGHRVRGLPPAGPARSRSRRNSGRVDEIESTMRSILALTQQGATVFAAAAMNRNGRDVLSLSSILGSSAIEYGASTVYAATESLAGIDPEADQTSLVPRSQAEALRIEVEYRCLKQREGEAVPLRLHIAPSLGPTSTPHWRRSGDTAAFCRDSSHEPPN